MDGWMGREEWVEERCMEETEENECAQTTKLIHSNVQSTLFNQANRLVGCR